MTLEIKQGKGLFFLGASIMMVIVFAMVFWDTLNITKISGSYYQRITQRKDLIADILPPPQFIVEPYLIMYQMLDETDKAKLEQLAAKARELRDQYEARHKFWAGTLPEGKTREELIVASYRPAVEFFEITDKQVMPAILRGDKENAHTLIRDLLTPKYEDHRLAIENVVKTAAEAIRREERESAVIVERRLILLVLLGLGIIGLALLHRRAEEKLRHASHYARSLIEASLDPLVTIDPEGRISDVNAATEEVTGYTRSELIGTNFSVYFTEPEKARAGYQQVFNQGFVRDYELEIRNRDGEITPVLYNASVYRDDAGSVIGVFAAARDIAKQKRAEEARSRLAAIVESSDDAIISKNLDGTITSWNEGAERLYGYSTAEALGRPVSILTLPNQQDEISVFMRQIAEGISIEHYETQRVRKDGRTIDVSLTLSPVRNRQGEIIGASAIARDISAQKRAEESVREERQRLFDVLETLPIMVCLLKPDYKVAFVNRSFRDKYGEAIGRPCYEIRFGNTEPCGFCETTRVFETGLSHHWEFTGPDGSIMDAYDFPFTDVDGSPMILEMHIDITERRRAERALIEIKENLEHRVAKRTAELTARDELLKQAQEIAHLGSWELDLVNNHLRWSDEVYRIFGLEPQEFVATYEAFLEAVHPDDRVAVDSAYSGSVRQGKDTYEIEHRVIRKSDGELRIVHEKCNNLKDESGRIIRSIGMVHDITERRRAEEKLLRAKQEWERTFDSVPDLIAILDTQHRVLRANREMARRLGVTPKECVGLHCYESVHGKNCPPVSCPHSQTLNDGLEHTAEVFEERLGGDFLVTTTPLLDEKGQMIGTVHVARDITVRKRMENELRKSRDELELRVEERTAELRRSEAYLAEAQRLTHTGSWGFDPVSRKYIYSSAERSRIYGFDQQEDPSSEEAVFQRIHPEDRDRWKANREKSLREKVDTFDEYRIVLPDGTVKHMHTIRRPVLNDAGDVVQLVGTSIDITERKRAEEALQNLLADLESRVEERTKELSEANQSLQAANKELDSFTYSVSHDLRAPLRAIDGFSMMVLQDYADKLDDEGRRKLNVIRGNTQQMGRLIDDLLTFSRLGRKEMANASLDMEAIVRSAWRELTLLDPERRIELTVQRLPHGMGDQTLIKEVVINLLSNAIKFTKYRENATVEVGACPEKETSVYFVKDNGVGFDMQYYDKLFGVFQRLHSADEFEGTGVGLAIVERILGRHGGRVWAEGKEGEGATFYFTLAGKGDG